MDKILEQPEFYEIIPEFNNKGRLCNYHTGEGESVKVPFNEWERFNRLAGRQHEIINNVVFFNADLEPCLPDGTVIEIERPISEKNRADIDYLAIMTGVEL